MEGCKGSREKLWRMDGGGFVFFGLYLSCWLYFSLWSNQRLHF